jgi:hypothetical protein
MSDLADSNAPPPAPNSADPLAAFLDGLHGLSSLAGEGALPVGSAGPPTTLLSNGLSADAGVALLVSALASLHDGNATFNATPFAAPSGADQHAVIAPALQ